MQEIGRHSGLRVAMLRLSSGFVRLEDLALIGSIRCRVANVRTVVMIFVAASPGAAITRPLADKLSAGWF